MAEAQYYYDYIIGTQSAWQAFAAKTGINLQLLQARAIQSTNKAQPINEYLYLVEVWHLNFSQLLWAWKNGLYVLRQYQSEQLGRKFKDITDRNGERILTDALAVVAGKEKEAIDWCRVFAPEMAWSVTQAQELAYIQTNGIKTKLQAMFDAYETILQIP